MRQRILSLICLLLLVPILSWAATATLTWDASTDLSTAGYMVYRGTSPECGNGLPLTTLLATIGVTTSFIDSTVPDTWTIACYEVSDFNSVGESGHSNQASKTFSAPTSTPPPSPTNLKVSKWNGSAWILLGTAA